MNKTVERCPALNDPAIKAAIDDIQLRVGHEIGRGFFEALVTMAYVEGTIAGKRNGVRLARDFNQTLQGD